MNRSSPFQGSEKGAYRLTAPCALMAEMKRKAGIVFSWSLCFLLFWGSTAWNPLSRPREKEINNWKKPQALHTIPIGF